MSFFENLNKSNKPPYFHDESFDPNFQDSSKAFSNANVILDHIPNLRSWLFDKLSQEIQDVSMSAELAKKIEFTLQSARNYDLTTVNLPPYETVITQLYVNELLLKILLYCYGKEPTNHHGYSFFTKNLEGFDFSKIGELKLGLRDAGLSQDIHKLFYSEGLKLSSEQGSPMPTLGEYFCFLPEVRDDLPRVGLITRACSCEIAWSATNAHPNPDGMYHYFNVDNSTETNKYRLDARILFPERIKEYTVSNYYSGSNLFENSYCDNLVSITGDINGNNFGLGFGEGDVEKQTDIEIRFYILYLLGTLARYHPDIWEGIKQNNKNWYFLISRFLEHNQYLFPMLILRYISGRTYQLGVIGRWG